MPLCVGILCSFRRTYLRAKCHIGIVFAYFLHHSTLLLIAFLRPFGCSKHISKLAYEYASKLFGGCYCHSKYIHETACRYFHLSLNKQRRSQYLPFTIFPMRSYANTWRSWKTWNSAWKSLADIYLFKFSLLSFVRHVIWQLRKICRNRTRNATPKSDRSFVLRRKNIPQMLHKHSPQQLMPFSNYSDVLFTFTFSFHSFCALQPMCGPIVSMCVDTHFTVTPLDEGEESVCVYACERAKKCHQRNTSDDNIFM